MIALFSSRDDRQILRVVFEEEGMQRRGVGVWGCVHGTFHWQVKSRKEKVPRLFTSNTTL